MSVPAVSARVVSVSRVGVHAFGKNAQAHTRLLEGLGVEGDAHCGVLVQHRSRVAKNPNQSNLRRTGGSNGSERTAQAGEYASRT